MAEQPQAAVQPIASADVKHTDASGAAATPAVAPAEPLCSQAVTEEIFAALCSSARVPLNLDATHAAVWAELSSCSIALSDLAYVALNADAGAQATAAAKIDATRMAIRQRMAEIYTAVFALHDANKNDELEINELETVMAEFLSAKICALPRLTDSVRSGILHTVRHALVRETPALAADPTGLSAILASQEPEINANVSALANGMADRLREVWQHPRKYSLLLFAQIDSNGDGRITRDEFVANTQFLDDLTTPDPATDCKEPAEPAHEAFVPAPGTPAATGVDAVAGAAVTVAQPDAAAPAAVTQQQQQQQQQALAQSLAVPQSGGPGAGETRASVSAAGGVAADLLRSEDERAARERLEAEKKAAAQMALGPQAGMDLSELTAARLKAKDGSAKAVGDGAADGAADTKADGGKAEPAPAAAPHGQRASLTAGGPGPVEATPAAAAAAADGAAVDGEKRKSVSGSQRGSLTAGGPGASADAAAAELHGDGRGLSAGSAQRPSMMLRAAAALPTPKPRDPALDERHAANMSALTAMIATLEARNKAAAEGELPTGVAAYASQGKAIAPGMGLPVPGSAPAVNPFYPPSASAADTAAASAGASAGIGAVSGTAKWERGAEGGDVSAENGALTVAASCALM